MSAIDKQQEETLMNIDIKVEKQSGGIGVVGYVDDEYVVSFSYYDGRWTTGGYSCLPSDIDKAKLYVECYSQAMAKVQELMLGSKVSKGGLRTNENLEPGDVVQLDENTPWATSAINNPLGVGGVVEKVDRRWVYVKWDNGRRNCYKRKDSDLIKQNI